MTDISIIVISYNTKDITKKCLQTLLTSLEKTLEVSSEIIVVDNGSMDGSTEMLKKIKEKCKKIESKIKIKLLESNENLGFARANNMALSIALGKYILFLNSDAIIKDVNFEDLIYYLDKNPEVGVVTVKIILPNGDIDWASHRGTPTIWRSFSYFSKLEILFSHIPKLAKLFGGYHLKHLDLNTIHEIDSPSGAFYLTRKDILDKTGGFDTRYFMYGEDIDLSHRIKKMGFKIIYYPLFIVIHMKYKSGLKRGLRKTEVKTKNYFYDAMKIFYDKHFGDNNGRLKNRLVHFFIDMKKKSTQ